MAVTVIFPVQAIACPSQLSLSVSRMLLLACEATVGVEPSYIASNSGD